jgi:hypothetical protein
LRGFKRGPNRAFFFTSGNFGLKRGKRRLVDDVKAKVYRMAELTGI